MALTLSCDIDCPAVSGDEVREKYPTYPHGHLSYSSCFLYVLGAEGGPYKVGYSVNPIARVEQLQTGHYDELKLWALSQTPSGVGMWVEEQVHRALDSVRVRREWFSTTLDNILAVIDLANPLGRHADIGGLTAKQIRKIT